MMSLELRVRKESLFCAREKAFGSTSQPLVDIVDEPEGKIQHGF